MLAAGAFAVAMVVLAVEFVTPMLDAAPRLEATFETLATLLALLTAVLLAARVIQTRSPRHMALFGGCAEHWCDVPVCVRAAPGRGYRLRSVARRFHDLCSVVTAVLFAGDAIARATRSPASSGPR